MVSQAQPGNGGCPGGDGMAGEGAGPGTRAAVAAAVLVLAGLGYVGWSSWRGAPPEPPPSAIAAVPPEAGAATSDTDAQAGTDAASATAAGADTEANDAAAEAAVDPEPDAAEASVETDGADSAVDPDAAVAAAEPGDGDAALDPDATAAAAEPGDADAALDPNAGEAAAVTGDADAAVEPNTADTAADPGPDADNPQVAALAPRTGDAPDAPVAPDIRIVEPALPGDGGGATPGGTPGAVAAAQPDPAPEMPEGLPPSFDTVRIEADGSALVAGGSAAASLVSIFVDGNKATEVTADASGKWVAIFSILLTGGPQTVTLEALMPDGKLFPSAQTVVLTPPPAGAPAVEAVAMAEAPAADAAAGDEGSAAAGAPTAAADETADAASTAAADETPDAAGSASDTVASAAAPGVEATAGAAEPEAPAGAGAPVIADAAPDLSAPASEERPLLAAATPPPAAEEPPAPPRVLLADDQGVRVLQPGGRPEALEQVAIDSISYDAEGAVILSGRGRPDGFVRIYLDNSEVITAAIDRDGQWRTDLPDVDKGVYTLRVDELDTAGDVSSRAETPFQREDPVEIAAMNPEAVPGPGEPLRITVQPGNTLWGIARKEWGQGILYVRVWEMNRGDIADPDLIYPGQVFAMPTLE
jgi:nucleoid-associated protein YgaU